MVEFGRVKGKVRFRVSTEKLYGRVPEKRRISVSTKKWKNRGEDRVKVQTVRVPKHYLDEYLKMVE